jgi:hypothetical protein
MNPLIESVARAIASEDGGPGNPLGYFPNGASMRLSTWEEFMPEQHEAWRRMARSAILALLEGVREPSEGMQDDAYLMLSELYRGDGGWIGEKAANEQSRLTWLAMHSALLHELSEEGRG